jgi:hypothetical protein
MIEFVTGLVPLFRREPVQKPRAARLRAFPPTCEEPQAVAPAEAEVPAKVFAEDAAREAPAAAEAPGRPGGGRDLSYRRFRLGAPPELRAARIKLADAARMAEVCRLSACRRARRCMGIGGASCLAEHRERVMPLLMALKERGFGEEDG